MGKERKKTYLREIANVVMGISPSSSSCNLNYEGFPLLNGPSEFGSHHPKAVQFTNNPKKFSKKGDLLFCVRGSTGRMNWSDQEYAIGRGLAAIQAKNGQLFSSFIKGCIEKELKNLLASSTGSVFSSVNRTQLEEIPVYLPSNEEITQIENVLGSLEKKIEINRKNYETLEEIAKALFKSWFIDFDPVKAKSVGHSSGLSEEISNLFPDSFEDSELGQVPLGWECGKLGNYISIKRGGSPRPIKDFIVENEIPWVKISDATASKNRFIFSTKEFIKSEGLSKTVYLKEGSLILSNSATPGIPKFLELDACIHDGWLHFPEKEKFSDLYLYQLFLSIRSKLCLLGNGSVFTNLKTDILKNYNVIIPSKECLDLFDMQVDSLHQRCKSLTKSSNFLCKIRSILLPKLISGEMRIPDAEKIIEEAGI